MHELAPQAVGAVHGIMVLLAEFGLVLAGNVSLLLEFIISVCKGATIPKFAFPFSLPILAHLYPKVYYFLIFFKGKLTSVLYLVLNEA